MMMHEASPLPGAQPRAVDEHNGSHAPATPGDDLEG